MMGIKTKCDILFSIGYPIPIHHWFKNDVPLTTGEGFKIISIGDNISRLIITKMTDCFEGEFKVKAVNDIGECDSSCKISVVKRNQMLKDNPTKQ